MPEWNGCRRMANGWRAMRAVLCGVLVIAGGQTAVADELGLEVAAGFAASQFADDELAHDVFCLTIDARGRVVVSGPGYVKTLVDADGDGRAERADLFAAGPQSGAQGMFFEGNDLLCVGDAGLLRYHDADGDGRADGPPEVLLRIKTGGEHHAHSVQPGPDGDWYLIAGNDSEVTARDVTSRRSPVQQPLAGAVLRLASDFRTTEIVGDGLRNAYDFAFAATGELFVCDSDDEREVSLPWYRPTRVVHLLPGAHAGWFSRGWKRPDDFADMPPLLCSLGRGSPTGVECYRHVQFPTAYHGALLVADWTFGRVVALPLTRAGSVFTAEPHELARGAGQFGFAPTDLAVGRDGSLYVSVGGRGTRGGVFRIYYTGPADTSPAAAKPAEPRAPLLECLDAPQPLSSWSRARWKPLARQLEAVVFRDAASDTQLSLSRRVRAIEILTELFGGLEAATVARLALDPEPQVRARAAWSWGRAAAGGDWSVLEPYLDDPDDRVARAALEALVGAEADASVPWGLVQRLADRPERYVRQVAQRLLVRAPADRLGTATEAGRPRIVPGFGANALVPAWDADFIRTWHWPANGAAQAEAIRHLQLALGDVGPRAGQPGALDGYRCRRDLGPYREQLGPLVDQLEAVYPAADEVVAREQGRLLAMLAPARPSLLNKVLARIGSDSHPTNDIHHLLIATGLPVPRDAAQRRAIAQAILEIDAKMQHRALPQDSYWEVRLRELWDALVARDAALPQALLDEPAFGWPAHVLFTSHMSAKERASAATRLGAAALRLDAAAWTAELVGFLADLPQPEIQQAIRRQAENPALREAVVRAIARRPTADDRRLLLQGLESSSLETLEACVAALERLPLERDAAEQIGLIRVVRRLGAERREYVIREKAARLLERSTGNDRGFEYGPVGYRPQRPAIDAWLAEVQNRFPDEAREQLAAGPADVAGLRELLAQTDWQRGDAGRGERLFLARACATCHGGRRALGPDLMHVTRRFARDDLFLAIGQPSRDVSPRYQAVAVETHGGHVVAGLVVYESADGVTLQTPDGTVRLEAAEIAAQRPLARSLMPTGLLDGLTATDYADLYAYLQGLGG